MTRGEAIELAVRKWWHVFNLEQCERDARRVGVVKAVALQRLFVLCVRLSFREFDETWRKAWRAELRDRSR